METIFIILTVGALNVACLFIGAKLGQAVAKGEKVEVAIPNPMNAIREHRAHKEAEMEQDRLEAIMRNIDNYDGTPRGQEDVPRG